MPPAPRVKPTCPHCWHQFEPHETLWISTHASLLGDVRLGPDAPRRFLPSRFDPRGGPLDERGEECTQIACPKCHLILPWVSLELNPWFVSIFGTPASGKSYFLAAMTRNLSKTLLNPFCVNVTDADARANQAVVRSRAALFAHKTPFRDIPLGLLIEKTKEQGDLYNTVLFGPDRVQYPQPFMFTFRPGDGHPLADDPEPVSRLLCLYDNAGESFLVGRDSAASPVTRHLAESALLLFLFDPTQHSPFHQRLVAKNLALASDVRVGDADPQEQILTEAASRVRRFARLRASDKHDRPLVVVVTKKDLWGPLVPELGTREPVIAPTHTKAGALNLDLLQRQSNAIKHLLLDLAPEVVSAAEAFAAHVLYVGVSSLGTIPRQDPRTKQWMIRPADINPSGVEIPILYGLYREFPKLVPGGRRPAGGGRNAI